MEKEEAIVGLTSLLSPYHKKAAQRIYLDVSRLIKQAPTVGHVGMLTLTSGSENITDPKELSRRFDSFNSNFLSKDPRFGKWLLVMEPQERGALHYHLLVEMSEDIRAGLNFEEIAQRRYGSASQYLREVWSDLRTACKTYGLGRHELLPIKSGGEAVGRYLGSYISKGLNHRTEEQKGARFVRYSQGWAHNSVNFSWNNKNSAKWRRKVKLFATYLGCEDFYQISQKLGPGWAWKYVDFIIGIEEVCMEQLNDKGTYEGPEYEDKTINAIKENQILRFQRLWAEAKEELAGMDAQRNVIAKKRKKEKNKAKIEKAKMTYMPTKEDIEKVKCNHKRRTEFANWLRQQPEPPF